VTGFTGEVDLSLSNAGTINPTDSGVFTAGVMNNLSVTIPGADTGVTIRVVIDAGTYGVDEDGESNSFDIAPGALAQFTFETQPGDPSVAGADIGVVVWARDANNNLITSYNTDATISDTTGTVYESVAGDTTIT